jgi:hypothetical protein
VTKAEYLPATGLRLTRLEAIETIREQLWAKTPEHTCACASTHPLGVVCGGFRRLAEAEFRDRFGWLAANRPNLTRRQLEDLVCAHHASRQETLGLATCCDVETMEHCGCEGWETFDDRTLERICLELTGSPVQIR